MTQFALNVAKPVKYHFNHKKADQFIAKTAMQKKHLKGADKS